MLPLSHLKHLPKHTPRSFTSGTLPAFVDPEQPPIKRQPFAALWAQRWVSELELILPEELAEVVSQALFGYTARYAKVIVKVGDLLQGDFFTNGVKKGENALCVDG